MEVIVTEGSITLRLLFFAQEKSSQKNKYKKNKSSQSAETLISPPGPSAQLNQVWLDMFLFV